MLLAVIKLHKINVTSCDFNGVGYSDGDEESTIEFVLDTSDRSLEASSQVIYIYVSINFLLN